MSALDILLPAFVFAALMVITHTWLGLHVLARGIIFVDLALAQAAALGAVCAFLIDGDMHGWRARLFALGGALLAGAGFSLLRRVADKTAREVVIGAAYVVATALSVLALSRSVQGMEALKTLLNGSILWVSWTEVAGVAAAYAALAALAVAARRRFHALSFGDGGGRHGWELAFFAAFAVVITLSVGVAGVLLVFACLIVPAFSASLLVAGFGARLALGIALGLAGSAGGLALAYAADLPVGASVVTALGALLPVSALARGVAAR
jgi:zinc/manganese transport system permease protein